MPLIIHTHHAMERIDVHAHCVPPAYREYCLENEFAGEGHPDGMPAIPVKLPLFRKKVQKGLTLQFV